MAKKGISLRIKTEGFHADKGEGSARGLYLQVAYLKRKGVLAAAHGVTRSWIYRYTSPVTGKARWMGLGSCEVIGLAEARELAKAARRLVTLGADPIDYRRTERGQAAHAAASSMTFAECATAYLDMHASTWKNDKHRAQWHSSLNRAACAFGNVPVAEIDTPTLVKFLEPIWRATPESGSRLRGRIEKVLDWAAARKFREGENPARWRGHLEHLLHARPKAEHHSAMPVTELPAFMVRLLDRESISARALELLILTATRTGEVINAKWSEVDFKAHTWTIPADRMKASREHVVPLASHCVALIQSLPRMGDYIFPGAKDGQPLSNMAMRELLKGMDANGYTPHGFRSTFRDWAGDVTTFDRETIEHALAHRLRDKAEAAYRRSTALEKRRLLMEAWAQYLGGEVAGSNVEPIRKRVELRDGSH